MKSDRLVYFLGKYFTLLVSFGILVGIVIEIINGLKTGDWDSDRLFIETIIGATCFALYFGFRDKFVMLELGNQKIKIQKGKDLIEVNWLDVESISQSRFSGLGLYNLRVRNIDGYFLFGTGSAINIAGHIIDDSELATLIEKKKRELNI
jgi:hypothetical protein